ncbi:hypothetical protein LJ737_15985 [Hymenobacter sp. 15J16-1T3B]|uniref:hypothetical protein n=1 Tax=Hymenobacter sp. 15J16-1T3B TaxID=2886941 RepID=UPI001D1017EE|nr:hypothetical protein [Hymenobacter sp. 15J16-1T3B]MCC3158745.1 hypothetical protein [Hymenobacter sp. 15J16-1T3B]
MKHQWFLIGAGLLLGAAGCVENDADLGTCPGNCTVVRGRLVTAGGTEALAGIPLTAQWVGGRYYVRQKAAATTDGNGNFELSFLLRDDELAAGYFQLQYAVKADDYYQLDDSRISLPDLVRDTAVTIGNYLVPRKAFVELAITNRQAIGPNDSYWSNFASLYGSHTVIGPYGGGPAIGWASELLDAAVPVPGDQPIVVNHVRNRNGIRTTSADTLYIPHGTRRRYTVTF